MAMPRMQARPNLSPGMVQGTPNWMARRNLSVLQEAQVIDNHKPASYQQLARSLGIDWKLPSFAAYAKAGEEFISREVRKDKEFVGPVLRLAAYACLAPNPANTIRDDFKQAGYVTAELRTLMRAARLMQPDELDAPLVGLGSLLVCCGGCVYPALVSDGTKWTLEGVKHWTYPDARNYLYLVWQLPIAV